MAYERKLTSFSELIEELRDLEADEGVRIVTNKRRRKEFVFVTHHTGRYALAICRAERRGRRLLPGRKISFDEFSDDVSLRNFLTGVVSKPLNAYIY